ncbi:hypothetical protein [Syntrophus aciditrophicus]|nr:hypothetical protein [Syntrophus aciditrophicus]
MELKERSFVCYTAFHPAASTVREQVLAECVMSSSRIEGMAIDLPAL